jgi:hypothetical protein
MPLSSFGPEDFEPFLSVYDQENRTKQRVREPAYAARLQNIYESPTSASGYTYGSALSGRKKALQGLAGRQSGLRAMEEVRTDLRKDADRRTWIANQARLAQGLENMRGRNVGAFANALTQMTGELTAPIRPGGEKHGEFKLALESAGQEMRERAEEQRANMMEAAEARRQFIEYIRETKGRDPDLLDWDTYSQYRRGN